MKTVLPRPCRCCGALTFGVPFGSGGICEVCGWVEASPLDHPLRVPLPDLATAIACFQRTGASDPAFLSSIRPPRPEEIPPGGQVPFLVQRERAIQTVLAAIHDTFAGVEPGETGIGLEDSRILDDHWDRTPPQDYLDALEINHATRWQDVLPGLLMHYREFFSFTNFEGFRYFAPAYAAASLQSLGNGARDFASDILLQALGQPRCDLFQGLTSGQQQALAGFLACFARFSEDEHDAQTAVDALAGYWGRFLRAAQVHD